MTKTPFIILAGVLALAACGPKTNQTIDRGFDSKSLQDLTKTPGIWVDGDGCEHWAIDDGIEGYQTNRLDRYGKPVCGLLPPFTLHGPDAVGSPVPDPI
ncbi:hypothetical protein SAMN04488012_11059 [Palleronia salina]|uniref:Lipoprotein n=1 Tax=Palleronia salina TaxID=313368 RepID=A0A1M6JPW0_9RHOB|nr:hypothetical protein [Palleronia salina]SHJ48686.1 hypothetical protein SAMN04488012_11059 [Palleronia salina]